MERKLAHKALMHWKEWLPNKYAELQASNQLLTAANEAATVAAREIKQLMDAGARLDEAEEIVLPKLILLPPEDQDEEDWEARELAELEESYQRNMAGFAETTEPD